MCVDCNPLETNTGLVHYSGPDLIICNGNTITNGELLTSVIAKFDNCIGILQSQLDMSSLVENSPCINLVKTSLLTVLQSILDTESAFCTQLQTLNTQLTALQNQVNNSPVNKVINVTACNGVTVNETPTSKTFQLGAFVPKKTILPYFGDINTDFFSTGLGRPSAGLSGWAIADGRNGTINACGRYLKYDCEGCCTTGGSNTITLAEPNIPEVSLDVDAEFTLNFTGETALDGKHRHWVKIDDDSGCAANAPDSVPTGDQNSCANFETGENNAGNYYSSYMVSPSGEHSHTFTVDSTVTGTFTSTIGNPSPTPINIEPLYIAGIPIQFLGC
jgi:hypothetical protein